MIRYGYNGYNRTGRWIKRATTTDGSDDTRERFFLDTRDPETSLINIDKLMRALRRRYRYRPYAANVRIYMYRERSLFSRMIKDQERLVERGESSCDTVTVFFRRTRGMAILADSPSSPMTISRLEERAEP